MKPQSFLKGSLLLGLSALTAKLLGALFKIPLTSRSEEHTSETPVTVASRMPSSA